MCEAGGRKQWKKAFFPADIETCHIRKSTGVINDVNDGSGLFKSLSGKSGGGGLCMRHHSVMLADHLPREFTSIMVGAVCVPPSANAEGPWLNRMTLSVSSRLNSPMPFCCIGRFQPAHLETVLPKLYPHVNFCDRRKRHTGRSDRGLNKSPDRKADDLSSFLQWLLRCVEQWK